MLSWEGILEIVFLMLTIVELENSWSREGKNFLGHLAQRNHCYGMWPRAQGWGSHDLCADVPQHGYWLLEERFFTLVSISVPLPPFSSSHPIINRLTGLFIETLLLQTLLGSKTPGFESIPDGDYLLCYLGRVTSASLNLGLWIFKLEEQMSPYNLSLYDFLASVPAVATQVCFRLMRVSNCFGPILLFTFSWVSCSSSTIVSLSELMVPFSCDILNLKWKLSVDMISVLLRLFIRNQCLLVWTDASPPAASPFTWDLQCSGTFPVTSGVATNEDCAFSINLYSY